MQEEGELGGSLGAAGDGVDYWIGSILITIQIMNTVRCSASLTFIVWLVEGHDRIEDLRVNAAARDGGQRGGHSYVVD